MSKRPRALNSGPVSLARLSMAGVGATCFALALTAVSRAEQSAPVPSAADAIAAAFSSLGRELYEECIFELSDEQVEVQSQLVVAYMEQGADGATARKLAAAQIQPPKPSKTCEALRQSPDASASSWTTELSVPEPKPASKAPPKIDAAPAPAEKPALPGKPAVAAKPSPAAKPQAVAAAPVELPMPDATRPSANKPAVKPLPTSTLLAGKQVLPQWDCASDVDYVTVKINGYDRKLTGGEICNRYEDVVREVPESLASFKLGYTISTGRLFVISDDHAANGRTIAWAISGRDVCRNNPDPDCLAARAVGSLPPGEYVFASDKAQRVSWGPKTKRNVVAVYLKKLWNKDRFNPHQTAGILSRRNIAIHVRLKGEMSEACIALEPKGWAYVAGIVKDGRATALNVYLEEPHVQIAEKPPLIAGSSFSLTSLFQ